MGSLMSLGGKTSINSIFGLNKKGAAPEEDPYDKQTTKTLRTQIMLAPELYDAESEYQPKYTALELKNLQTAMFGTPEQRGLMSLQQEINPLMSRMEAESLRAQREADIGDVERYGGRATTALRDMSGNTQLLNEFNRQAMEDLQAGQNLTPAEQRFAQQSSRAAFSARGIGMGSQAIQDEVLKQYQLGNERQAQRRQFAGNVVGMNQQTGGDPFMAILGRPGQAFQAGQGFGGQAGAVSQGSGPSMFNPESSYAGNLYNQRYQAEMAAKAGAAANKASMIGSGVGAIGMAAAAYF